MHYTLKGNIARAHPYQIDPSLTIEGAGADAKATGNAIRILSEALDDKLGKSSIQEVITTALAEAKASGDFNGKDGEDGFSPVKGKDYFDGQDGQDGDDGYSPVRGKDYWTASDIAEIKSYVDTAILGGTW